MTGATAARNTRETPIMKSKNIKRIGALLIALSFLMIVIALSKTTIVSVYNGIPVYSHKALEQDERMKLASLFVFLTGAWLIWASQ